MTALRPVLLAALLVTLAAVPAQAANGPAKLVYGDYDLRMSVSMKSDFSFNPAMSTTCGEPKLAGYAGSGTEILQMSSPKPVRVSLFSEPKSTSIMRKDLRPGFPLVGETRRSGDFTQYICGNASPTQAARCTGTFPLRIDATLAFLYGGSKVIMDGDPSPSTRDQVPGCSDDVAFDWDGAAARTGTVLLEPATAPSPRSKLKAKAFTLTATYHDGCEVGDFGTGACATTWTWKANLRKVSKKKGRR